jgi:hypothetical protein
MATLMKLKKPGSTGTKKSTTTAKRTATKPAAKRSTAAKKTTTKKTGTTRKPAAKKAEPTQRRGIAHLDPKVLKQFQSELTEVGERLAAAQKEHDDASEAVHEIAAEARSNDIPMNIVTELLGVSRQYLYKGLVGHGPNGRKNGGAKKSSTTKKATSAAKKTAIKAKPAAKKAAVRKPAGKKLSLKR